MGVAKRTNAWTDADYAAKGLGRVFLRLPVEVLAKLDALVERTGKKKAEIIEDLISAAYRRK